mmetsp:Transcript_3087/g.3475  ORF Transcript_3087/g.3475 Transcript_3087/m.3475 type:complete len:81 (-) Transcript_3087:199-441(-)
MNPIMILKDVIIITVYGAFGGTIIKRRVVQRQQQHRHNHFVSEARDREHTVDRIHNNKFSKKENEMKKERKQKCMSCHEV